jgi:hypothetical protein
MIVSQTRAQTINTQLALGNTRKGDMSIAEYVGKMKALGDEMKAADWPLDDEGFIEYIITNLDEEYTPLVYALCARVEPISISELFSQLLNFETRVNLFLGDHHHSANSMGRGHGGTRGRGGTHGRGGCGSNPGHGGPRHSGGRGQGRGSSDDDARSMARETTLQPNVAKLFLRVVECYRIFELPNFLCELSNVGISMMNLISQVRTISQNRNLLLLQTPTNMIQTGMWTLEQLII